MLHKLLFTHSHQTIYTWIFPQINKYRFILFLTAAQYSMYAAAAAAKSLQLWPTLCDAIDGSPPGSPVPVILQARTLEWVAISFSNAWKWKVKVKSLSRVRLFATPWTACSLPGSSIHGIFQARVLEWGAIAFSDSMYDTTIIHLSFTYRFLKLFSAFLLLLQINFLIQEAQAHMLL